MRGTGRGGFVLVFVLMIGMLAFVTLPAAEAGKLRVWSQDDAEAFRSGTAEGVIVSDGGRISLARHLETTAPMEAARVWDLAVRDDGAILAATGDEGKVVRLDPEGDRWQVVYDDVDSQVLSLATLPDGRVAVGTGPGGQVVVLSVEDQAPEITRPGPEVRYIWDLAVGPDGLLHAVTGPEGRLWRRDAEGRWSMLFDSRHDHLLCVAVSADGSIYTGGEEGVLYRIKPGGEVIVIYDAPEPEIRSLLLAPDGSVFAGTASEAGDSDRGAMLRPADPDRSRQVRPVVLRQAAQGREIPRGTAATGEAEEGENVVYRITEGDGPREVFRAEAIVYALAWWQDRLMVGTGPDGALFEVVGDRAETAPLARLDHGQILALEASGENRLWVGAGAPGSVLVLHADHEPRGTLTSEVLDADRESRFGAVRWTADQPEGTSISFQTRTGNVETPDATWSDWSSAMTDPESARADRPPGRFAQYRLTLSTDRPDRTPVVDSVTIRYQSVNLPPEIQHITIPDLSEGDGATRQTTLALEWEAVDPNEDELTYALAIRKEGWPGWVRVGDEPLSEPNYEWDTTSVPAGSYRLRLTTSDRRSNLPDEAFERSMVSEPFLVDHQAPEVSVRRTDQQVEVALSDNLTRIARAEFALDGGDWTPVFPGDGLFDTKHETVSISLSDRQAGTHVLVVRASDAAGNVGAGDLVLDIEGGD